jgi:hypothetical protein
VEKFLELRKMMGMRPEYPGNCNDFVFGHLQKIRDILTSAISFSLGYLMPGTQKDLFFERQVALGRMCDRCHSSPSGTCPAGAPP